MKKVLLGLSLVGSLYSKTYQVSTTTDLRDALFDIQFLNENNEIILQAGKYNTNSDGYGTFNLSSQYEVNLTIRASQGFDSNDVVFNGNNNQIFNFTSLDNINIYNISLVDGSNTNGIYSDSNININSSSFYNTSINCKNLEIENSDFNKSRIDITGDTNINNSDFNNSRIDITGDSNITNSNFYNAKGFNSGGVIKTNNAIITNSNFLNNIARSKGGAIYLASGSILNCKFKDNKIDSNSHSVYGGAIYHTGDSLLTIENTEFINNSTNSKSSYDYSSGSVIYSKGNLNINTSMFKNNKTYSYSSYYCKYTIFSSNLNLINSIFYNNRNGSYFIYASSGNIINNTFLNNGDNFIKISSGGNLINNILIDSSYSINNKYNNLLSGNLSNNIKNTYKTSSLLNSTDFNLLKYSPLINKGLNPNSDKFINLLKDDNESFTFINKSLNTDYYGNKRVLNNTIDIGAVEYNGELSSIVNNVDYVNGCEITGDKIVDNEIVFDFNVINPNNEILKYYILEDGEFKKIDSKTITKIFSSSGNYTITFKVVGSNEDIYKAKVSIYDTLSGDYNNGYSDGIEKAKNDCKNNPESCGIIVPSIASNKSYNYTLANGGWHNIGVLRDSNISIFDNSNISVIWKWNGANQSWEFYSTNNSLVEIANNIGVPIIENVNDGEALWIRANDKVKIEIK